MAKARRETDIRGFEVLPINLAEMEFQVQNG